MICKNCLVDPICKVACDKLKDTTIDELKSNKKITKRILNSNFKLKLVKDDIEVCYSDKTICWYKNGKLHREYGPAVEYYNGDRFWFKNGKRHREDGPAIEYSNGNKYWYINGLLNREDGPALECFDGKKYWYKDGKLTRCYSPETTLTRIKRNCKK